MAVCMGHGAVTKGKQLVLYLRTLPVSEAPFDSVAFNGMGWGSGGCVDLQPLGSKRGRDQARKGARR